MKVDLNNENDCLKKELHRVKCMIDKISKEKELQQKQNQKLKYKISYLKGQIEAYQYALNCRRY